MLTKPVLSILAGSLVLFAVYHAHFLWQLRRQPEKTVIAWARRWRRAWVERMIARQDRIVVVQACRNRIRSASFLAST